VREGLAEPGVLRAGGRAPAWLRSAEPGPRPARRSSGCGISPADQDLGAKLLHVRNGSQELQRLILQVMAAQSVGRLGMPLTVIRAALPRTSDRLIDRALGDLTLRDLIEPGPVPGMRRLVDPDLRATTHQNQRACRSVDGLVDGLVADRIATVIADLIARARAAGPEPGAPRKADGVHPWDGFEIFDQPSLDEVPLEIQALSEARHWPRHAARAIRTTGGAVVRRIGDLIGEHTGSSQDQDLARARRAQDQRQWWAYLAEVRALDQQHHRRSPDPTSGAGDLTETVGVSGPAGAVQRPPGRAPRPARGAGVPFG
jgi:hypothetical protein